jgi:AAA ATPase domain
VAIGVQHLVGREEELAALLDLLGAVDKLPTVATLVGEAGIGKTTVLRVAAEAAEDQGYRVLSCRPAEAEVRLSFVGLADLIGGVVPDVLPRLPRPQRRALEVALALTQSDDAAADERVVAFAFLSALRTLSSGTRLVVAVDDVQWLDAPSLAMLQFALSRLETEPVAAIITARDEVPVWLRRGVPEERLVTLRLGPLSLGAVHELLRTRMTPSFPGRPSCASGRHRAEIPSWLSSLQALFVDMAAASIPVRSCRFLRLSKCSFTSVSIASGRSSSRLRESLPPSRIPPWTS